MAPDFQPILDQLGLAPPIPSMSIEAARAMSEAMDFGEPEAVQDVQDLTIPGDDISIPARLYMPSENPAALLIFYHGGGWALGTLDTYDKTCRGLARRANCAILSIGYRLAPEHRFPAAIDDAWRAYTWARANRGVLPCPDGPLLVAGDSAGGNLAGAVAIIAKETGHAMPDGQFLIYPVTDGRTERKSYDERGTGSLLTTADMRYFYDLYAPQPESRNAPHLSLLAAQDLSDLPPTAVMTAEFDPLRDEGIAYAEAVERAGVKVLRHHFDVQPHGFMPFFPIIPSAAQSFEILAANLKTLIQSI